MKLRHLIAGRTGRFRCDEAGAALVEFALVLPLLIILFGVTIEGARMVQSFQSVNTGVRDGSRYLARVAPANVCTSGTLQNYQARVQGIVVNKVTGASTNPDLEVTSVTLACAADPRFVTISATLRIGFPFGALLELGGAGLTEVTTTVRDQARIFGL